jgi:hypothetical protein
MLTGYLKVHIRQSVPDLLWLPCNTILVRADGGWSAWKSHHS